ncbi:hypothetical protein HPULCUR_011783 [Helicostylum pulchrum]|uniref:RNB domain-containing protein n=1 Tax=Helicostylum pulchrum TaxID=562976 RepID=A0ABP9YH32_9FUNG
MAEEKDTQHPLALNDNQERQQQDLLSVDDNTANSKKPSHNRRRGRGGRRHSSSHQETKPIIVIEEVKSDNDRRPSENRHRRRKSSSATVKPRSNNPAEEKESLAFQSLVDIIHEIKRLPLVSITPDKHEPNKDNSWKRVRRHSEPAQEMKRNQQHIDFKLPLKTINEQQQQKHVNNGHGKPIFSNSFLSLESEDCENNNETLVSPLTDEHSNRTRSKSVPNNVLQQQHQQHEQSKSRKALFPAHLSVSDASAAVRAHTLFSGILRVDLQDSSDANVECEELDASIYIYGSRNRNRALDGDEVAVELVDVDEMLEDKQSKLQARYTRRLSSISMASSSNTALSSIPEEQKSLLNKDKLNLSLNEKSRPRYCGRIVCILERPKNMLFSGTLSLYRPHAITLDNASRDKKDIHGPKIIWFIPADKRLPLVAVPIKHAPANFVKYHEEYKNRIFIGNIQRWPATSLHPFGLIEKEIGWMGELGVHSAALMADHHIKDMEFSESALKAAAATPGKITNDHKKSRRDLTKECISIFTIGESNVDLDTAYSVTNTEKGIFEIGVHVTDVSNYVRLNTPLDREARERSCSVNLVDRRVSILPRLFTESCCSLGVENHDRLAFSVLCRFTENGVLLHSWIGKTVIKSKGHVNVSSAQQSNPLKEDADTILSICQKLQHNRLHKLNGQSLAKSYEIFKITESGYPEEISRINQTDKDVLLQELSIVANIEVAQKISSRFPDQALLYRQDEPKLSKLAIIQDYFDNDPLAGSVNGLIKLIKEKEISKEKQEALLHIIRHTTPASKYFSAGSVDIAKYRHFGFGAPICTVFTEPIHNYASIYVQRQLCDALKGMEQEDDNFDHIDKIARHCNSSQLNKKAAEQDCKKLYTAAYIYRQYLDTDIKNIIIEALVIQFGIDSLRLYIPEYDLELSVVLNESSVPGAKYKYDSTMNEMDIVWRADEEEEEETVTQRLKFLSSVGISINVNMKVVRPLFKIEILKL